MKVVAYINPQCDSELLALINFKYKVLEAESEKAIQKRLFILENNTIKLLYVAPANKLSLFFWFKITLPKILKAYGNPIFLQSNQSLLLKNYTNTFLFLNSHTHFKKKLIKVIKSAKRIFVAENFIKNNIITTYKIIDSKIFTLHYSANFAIKKNILVNADTIKSNFTNGTDFFFCEIDASSLNYAVEILKAFSQFKNRQKSTLKIIFFSDGFEQKIIVPNFKNYLYKNDVIFVNDKVDMALAFIAASFAMLYFTNYRMQNYALFAFANNIPVLALQNDINLSLFEDVVFYATADTLTFKLQELYKNETVVKNLTTHAAKFVNKYSLENASAKFFSDLLIP